MATVSEVYKITKDIMFEKGSSTIYDEFVISNINRLLVELFEENNICRLFKDKALLASPQRVTSTTDELTYEDEIVYNVLPLGLAARFFIDDDLNKYTIFATDYNNARVIYQRMVPSSKIQEAKEALDAS